MGKLLNCGPTYQKREKERKIKARNTTNRYKYTNTTPPGGNPTAVSKYNVPKEISPVANCALRRAYVKSTCPR